MASRKHSPIQDQWENGPVLLLSFSGGVSVHGPVPASRIFSELLAEGAWYLPRSSRYLVPNETTVAFYQSGSGVRGHALVLSVTDASENEQNDIRLRYGVPQVSVKLGLGRIEVFPEPVEIRPLVHELQFVKNKTHWGHSVRTSPRTINDHDFETIKAVAARSAPATGKA